ncbi:MAG: YecA family protein [Lacrimispora sphenoides]
MSVFAVNYPEMVVEKSKGLTVSERKLAALGYQTFLRLWSYPNPYKMQSNGKELCDLLIVFDNHIIIFSDKECAYGDSGNSQVDWRRWYKKAIQKSVEQLIGAKHWIERYTDRIAVDATCQKKFPLMIEITPETKFHLIAIAHGASEQCKVYFSGGDGGLAINSQIVGKMHTGEDCEPFYIGQVVDDPKTFIHVFDDASYANVLGELDTLQDFLRYLEARQELLLTKDVFAGSENDILALHIKGVIKGDAHTLQERTEGYTAVSFEEGLLDEVRQSYEYIKWRDSLKTSYFWDTLLQKTFFFIENGLSAETTSPVIQEQSQLFKRMAREDRAHRYCLSDGFLSFLSSMNPDCRGTRLLYNPEEPDTCYLLFLLPRKKYMKDEEYRAVRRMMLSNYCAITKVDYPKISHIIGVAHESVDGTYTSEDFIYLDASEWSTEQQTHALSIKQEYEEKGLLGKRRTIPKTYFMEKRRMKGRDRNKPCPCGSGKKFKSCCGQNLV